MEMFYQTSGMHCFVKVCLGDSDDVLHNQKTYMIHMIENNEIPYIISPISGEIDGKVWVKYCVDSKVNLKRLFKQTKPDCNFLKQLINQINMCIKGLEKYLLTPDDLVLDPEYILFDGNKNSLMLIYVPNYNKELKNQIRSLLEYVMVNFEHRDKKGLDVMYETYDMVSGDNFEMECIDRMLNKNEMIQNKNEMTLNNYIVQVDKPVELSVYKDKKESNLKFKFAVMIFQALFAVLTFVIGVFWEGGLKFIIPSIASLIFLIFNIISLSDNKIDGEDAAMREYEEKSDYERVNHESINYEPIHYEPIHKLIPMTNAALKEIDLDGMWDNIIVGRGKNCADYVLSSNGVSRVHARITRRGNDICVEDKESANGTYVNSVRIDIGQLQVIKKGDIVSFANEEFFVR